MLGEDLSRALSDISMEKIEKAAKMERRSGVYFWVKVAACAATVALVIGMVALMWPGEEKTGNQLEKPTSGMTAAPTLPTDVPPETLPQKFFAAPGILKVYGSSKVDATEEELKQYEMTDGIGSYGEVITIGGGISKGISLLFRFPEDYFGESKISFVVSADYGRFLTADRTSKETVVVENGGIIWWKYGSLKEIEENREGRFYANVIIYADGKAVGYGIIDFCYGIDNFNAPIFWTTSFTTVCYPLVDGEYQDVTEEYLWEQIAAHKKMKSEEGEVERPSAAFGM